MEFSNVHHLVSENAMDIDSGENSSSSQQIPAQDDPVLNDAAYDVVVVSSVGLHVEGPVPYINPDIPEQHSILQIESTDLENDSGDPERISPTISATSSREPSPINVPDENSQSECTNRYVEEKESKKRSLSEDEDDGRLCPICLDNWTNTGEHRICALKCGHLFGYKCVNRWLESQPKKSCPTCKKRVNRSDPRFIYAKKLIAVDTTELDMMKQLLDAAVEEKNKILLDISKYVCREHMLNQEIAQLKRQIQELTSNKTDLRLSQSTSSSNMIPNIARLYMDKSLDICRQSGCRVFDANSGLDLIMASMRSPNNLFSGFGLRKVNISQYKPLAFLPLHNLQIRDICFHPIFNWVLTASMDKSFKVLDTVTNYTLYTSTQQTPLWSCCWDANNHYVLYVGTQSGSVAKYDVRNLNTCMSVLSVPGDMSPVVSVASIPSSPGADLANGGVISCKLNSLWVFENSGNDFIRHALSLEGPFVSMKYDNSSRQLLVSSRPNNRISYSRHTLCTLEKVNSDKINCNILHCFQGGGMQKLLSKSCFISDKQEYVAAHQESSKSVYLWSINTGQRVCAIPAHDAVLDLRGMKTSNGNFLVSLTEKKLEFFKFLY